MQKPTTRLSRRNFHRIGWERPRVRARDVRKVQQDVRSSDTTAVLELRERTSMSSRQANETIGQYAKVSRSLDARKGNKAVSTVFRGKQYMALVKVLPSQPHYWKDLTHHCSVQNFKNELMLLQKCCVHMTCLLNSGQLPWLWFRLRPLLPCTTVLPVNLTFFVEFPDSRKQT